MGAEEEDDLVDRAAAERRERLRALKAAKQLLETPNDDEVPPPAPVPAEKTYADVPAAPDRTREETSEDLVDQAAAARRERLKALREAKRLLETPDEDTTEPENKAEFQDEAEDQKPNLKFRNYVPSDKQLQEHKLAPPVLPKFDDLVTANPVPEKTEDPFLNIAPKKPNWDLRRDVQKKLDKIERRTQKAIYKLYLKQQEEKRTLEENGVAAEED